LLNNDALRGTGNVLLIEMHGELARYAGLSEVWLVPSQMIQPLYASCRAWQSGGAWVIVGLAQHPNGQTFSREIANAFGACRQPVGHFPQRT
jgi:hypothetical protein